MNLDFKTAANYFLKDAEWKFKMSVLVIVSIMSTILTLSNTTGILALPFYLFTIGYMVLITHNLINNTGVVLPEFDYKKIFITGGKYFGVVICYMLLVIFLIMLLGTITSFVKALSIIVMLAVFITGISLVFMSQFVFAENLSFKEAFDLTKILNIFKENLKDYLSLFIIIFVIGIIESGILKMVDNTPLSLIFNILFSALGIFIALIFLYLGSQIYRQSLSQKPND